MTLERVCLPEQDHSGRDHFHCSAMAAAAGGAGAVAARTVQEYAGHAGTYRAFHVRAPPRGGVPFEWRGGRGKVRKTWPRGQRPQHI